MDQVEGTRIVFGAMCGTSLDGLDVAAVRVSGTALSMTVDLLDHGHCGLGPLREPLRRAASQEPMSCRELSELAWGLGELHSDAFESLSFAPNVTPDLASVHGQTVFHAPPLSWQLIDPAPITRRLGCPVVWDLRRADLAAGGQGAPITPLADWILFRTDRPRAVVNLGGFSNLTLLPGSGDDLDAIEGFDICACNHLLDAISRETTGEPYDLDGTAALRGTPDPTRTNELTDLLTAQASAGRSLGTGDELLAWVLAQRADTWPPDLAATAVMAIARCVATSVPGASGVPPVRVSGHDRTGHGPVAPGDLVIAGGGAFNRGLVAALRTACAVPVVISEDLGIPVSAREAVAIAVLGALARDGVMISLPQVTGRSPQAVVQPRVTDAVSCVSLPNSSPST